MQDGGRILVAGLLRGLRRSFWGGVAWTSESRGRLRCPGTPLLGRVRVPILEQLRRWWAGGHEAWCCLVAREVVSTRPVWGASRWLGLGLPALHTPAAAGEGGRQRGGFGALRLLCGRHGTVVLPLPSRRPQRRWAHVVPEVLATQPGEGA